VVERDSSYEFSSTALSTSAIRQQFSNRINVKISQFGIEVIRGFKERMAPFYHDEPVPSSASASMATSIAARSKGWIQHEPASICGAASAPTRLSSSPVR
jgi:hypothetical protein